MTDELQAAFGSWIDATRDQVDYEYATLYIYEPDRRFVRMVGMYPPGSLVAAGRTVQPALELGVDVVASFPEGIAYAFDDIPTEVSALLRSVGIRYGWSGPLLVDGRNFGVLNVGRGPRPFQVEEQRLLMNELRRVTRTICAELDTRAAAAQEARRMLVSLLGTAAENSMTPEELFDSIDTLLHRALPIDYASLSVLDGPGHLRLAGASPDIGFPRGHRYSVEEAQLEAVINVGAPLVQYRPGHVRGTWPDIMDAGGFERVGVLVMRHMDEILGSLVLAKKERYPFSEPDVAFIEMLGALLAHSLMHRRALQRQADETENQRILRAVAEIAAAESDMDHLAGGIRDALEPIVPEPFVAFGRVVGDEVVFTRANGDPVRRPLALYEPVREEGNFILDSIAHVPADSPGHALKLTSIYLNAVRFAGQLMGFLAVASRRQGFRFSEREAQVLQLVSQIIGPTVQQLADVERIVEEKQLLSLVFDSLDEGVALLDCERRVAFANQTGERVIALLEDRARNSGLDALDLESVAGHRLQLEVDRERRWYRLDLNRVEHPRYQLLMVASDVTADMEQAERQRQHDAEMHRASRLAALGQLVGGVAHELNNPLTAILGFAQILSSAPEAAEIRDDLATIQTEAERARDIVSDLLFIARKDESERRTIEAGSVISHIQRLRRRECEQRGIALTTEFPGGDFSVTANGHQLTQVLLNLVTNAEDALEGCADPAINVRALLEREGTALFEVRDNGSGMSNEVRERIFEPFFTTKQGKGTGLGMSLVRGMVDAHDGSLDIESAPGAGTRITIRIPTAPATTAEPSREHDSEKPAGPLRVLVIDDEPTVGAVTARMLEKLGHVAMQVVSVDDAVELLESGDEPDFILCDYRLGGMTADALADRIETDWPGLLERFIVMTGATTDEGVVSLVNRIHCGLIAKPFRLPDLGQALRAS